MIQLVQVSKKYDRVSEFALKDISFSVEEGEFVFLIGPSGSGKTSILRMLIREEKPTEGQIYFDDYDITRINRSKVYKLRRLIGVIFQDYKLVAHKNVYENVAFAMEVAGQGRKEIKETVPYVLDIVGLPHKKNSFPHQLSGGEQQRVAIARAMANSPRVLIADEPTGNLDPASAWDIVQILSKINSFGTTVIMSTHGTDIVNALNKRVIQLEKGAVVRDDSKGQYEFTSNSFSESILKSNELEDDQPKSVIKVNLRTDKIREKLNSRRSTTASDDKEEDEVDEFVEESTTDKSDEKVKNIETNSEKNDRNQDIEKKDNKDKTKEDKTKEDKSKEDKSKEDKSKEDKSDDKVEDSGKSSTFLSLLSRRKSKNPKEEDLKVESPKDKKDFEKALEQSVGLAGNRYKIKSEISEHRIDDDIKKLKKDNIKNIEKDSKKIQVDNLDIDDDLVKALVKAGYKNISDIIYAGPDKLVEDKIIDPIDIVEVSQALGEFVDVEINRDEEKNQKKSNKKSVKKSKKQKNKKKK